MKTQKLQFTLASLLFKKKSKTKKMSHSDNNSKQKNTDIAI